MPKTKNDPWVELFAKRQVGLVKVMGIDVKLRTLGYAETGEVLAECQHIDDLERRAHEQMALILARALVQVGDNALPEDLSERIKLIKSWDQGIVEKLSFAYAELRERERQKIDELKN